MEGPITARARPYFLSLCTMAFIVQLLFFIIYGLVFLDDGFYLSAAKNIIEGHLPYRDFFFVQPPVYAYIYGLAQHFTGVGLLPARFISAIFGILSYGLVLALARRIGGRTSLAFAAAFLACSSFQAYHFAIVKLYALAAFWLLCGMFLIVRRSSFVAMLCGAACLSIASATRLTLLPALPITALYLLAQSHFSLTKRLLVIISMVAAFILIMLPFYRLAPEQMYYFLFGIHVSASQGIYKFGLLVKLKVIARLLAYSCAPVLLLGGLTVFKLKNQSFRFWDSALTVNALKIKTNLYAALGHWSWYFWLVFGAVSGAHFIANWFSADYESVVTPVFFLAVSLTLSPIYESLSCRFKRSMIALFSLAALIQMWFGIHEFSLYRNGRSALDAIEKTARYIHQITPPGDRVLTCNSFYSIEADRAVVSGFEGAPFTFTPQWDREASERFHGYNAEIVVEILQQRSAGALVLYPDSFATGFPGFHMVDQKTQDLIWRAVHDNYRQVASFPNFHGAGNEVAVFIPSDAAAGIGAE